MNQLKPLRSNILQVAEAAWSLLLSCWSSPAFKSKNEAAILYLNAVSPSFFLLPNEGEYPLSPSPPLSPCSSPMLMDSPWWSVTMAFGRRACWELWRRSCCCCCWSLEASQEVRQLSMEQSGGCVCWGHSLWVCWSSGNAAVRHWVETLETNSESCTFAASRPTDPKSCLPSVSCAFSSTVWRYFPCASIRSCKCRCTYV